MMLLHSHSPTGLTFSGALSAASLTLKTIRIPSSSFSKKTAILSLSYDRLIVLSVSTLESLRRPSFPRDGSLCKPITLIGERLFCSDTVPGKKLELKYAKQPCEDFCTFMENTPKEEIVAFFRDIVVELEVYRQLKDFHLKIRNGVQDFRVEVYYGEERPGPDIVNPGEACIACFPNAPLYPEQQPIMEARECILEEFSDQPYVVSRLDAKGRCGFGVSPVRHVERMADLDDDEIYALWYGAVRILRQADLPFISLILNHGSYRTLEHLYLKVWIKNHLHEAYRMRWSEKRQELWTRLQVQAMNRPRRQESCLFFRKNHQCRHGDLCSYLHVVDKTLVSNKADPHSEVDLWYS